MNQWTDPEFDRPDAPQNGDRIDSHKKYLGHVLGAILSVLSEEECIRIERRLTNRGEMLAATVVKVQRGIAVDRETLNR
jgi:hypothetical protein